MAIEMEYRLSSFVVSFCLLPTARSADRLAMMNSMQSSPALRRALSAFAGAVLAIMGMVIAPASFAKDRTDDIHWVGTWSASPQIALSPIVLKDQTIRQIVRVSIGGKQVRLRLSNAYGADPLVIGAVHVALHGVGAAIEAGSDRMLTFGGSSSTTIPPGALTISDPVDLKVPALADVVVSIYVVGSQFVETEHSLGLQTTYISSEGNFSAADSLPTIATTQSLYFLTSVEVDAAKSSMAIVTLGDSITDGYRSTADAYKNWPNRLAERLAAEKDVSQVAVLNAGITGNRVLHDNDKYGSNALERLDRDVLVQSGARYLIVLLGINDIGFPGSVTTDEIIAGHRQIIDRAHAMGLRVYGGTLTPFKAYLSGLYYTSTGEAQRQAVNQWIRTSNAYDAVIDFDKVIRDPSNPTAIHPAYDSGDNLHPNDFGYLAMANAIKLSLFKNQGSVRHPGHAKSLAVQTGKPKPAL